MKHFNFKCYSYVHLSLSGIDIPNHSSPQHLKLEKLPLKMQALQNTKQTIQIHLLSLKLSD